MAAVAASGATTVIFDDELSPGKECRLLPLCFLSDCCTPFAMLPFPFHSQAERLNVLGGCGAAPRPGRPSSLSALRLHNTRGCAHTRRPAAQP